MSDMSSSNTTTPSPLTTTTTATNEPTNTDGSQSLTMADVENIWIQAGGNPQAAAMAAAVADASSGLNPNATETDSNGNQTVGLWLISTTGSPAGSTDPIANARAAVQLSQNGTDWSSWCVAWSDNNCGLNGGSYLGDGSNALAALGSDAYNVIGSTPSGDGTSASTASTTSSSTTSSKSHTILYIIALLGVVALAYYLVRRGTGESGGEGQESQGRSQASWTPQEEAAINDSSKTDKQLSSELGRSVRSIRVRRNQMK